MKRIIVIFCLLVMAFSINARAYKIELNLEKGKSYPTRMSLTSKFNESFGGKEIDMDMSMIMESDFQVTDIQDTIYKSTFTYKDFHIKVKTMGVTIEVKPGMKDKFSEIFSQFIGKQFTCDLSKSGKVSNVHGLKELFEQLMKEQKDLPNQQLQQIRSQFDQSFGGDANLGNMLLDYSIFPGREVGIGDEWEGTTQVSSTIPFATKNKYKLIVATDSYYLITCESDFTLDYSQQTQNASYHISDMGGKGKSTIKLNRNTCWVENSDVKMNMNGNILVKDGIREINVPMKMEFNIILQGK